MWHLTSLITEPRDNHDNFISGWLTNLNKANRIKELSAERMKNCPNNCQSFVVNLPIYLNSVLTNLPKLRTSKI